MIQKQYEWHEKQAPDYTYWVYNTPKYSASVIPYADTTYTWQVFDMGGNRIASEYQYKSAQNARVQAAAYITTKELDK